jgi:hypothetical protein
LIWHETSLEHPSRYRRQAGHLPQAIKALGCWRISAALIFFCASRLQPLRARRERAYHTGSAARTQRFHNATALGPTASDI